MPTYVYEYLDGRGEPTGEFFEVVQTMKEGHLERHPEDGRRCRRAITAPAIAGKLSPLKAKGALSDKNLERLGFTKYQNVGGGKLEKRAGKEGPKILEP